MVTFPLDHPLRPAAEEHFGFGRFIAVKYEAGGPRNCCHRNVDREVARRGGRGVVGWQIDWWPGLYVRALPHAVIERPDGALADVTEGHPGDPAAAITFVPVRAVQGRLEGAVPGMAPSRYFIIADAPEVHEMIAAAEAQRALKQRLDQVMTGAFGFIDTGDELVAPDRSAEQAFDEAHHGEMARSVLRVDRALAACEALAARLAQASA
jgi:hypothetical protein